MSNIRSFTTSPISVTPSVVKEADFLNQFVIGDGVREYFLPFFTEGVLSCRGGKLNQFSLASDDDVIENYSHLDEYSYSHDHHIASDLNWSTEEPGVIIGAIQALVNKARKATDDLPTYLFYFEGAHINFCNLYVLHLWAHRDPDTKAITWHIQVKQAFRNEHFIFSNVVISSAKPLFGGED